MKVYSLFLCIDFCYIYRYTSIKIKLELKNNILKFGYRINYKYEGMLPHSFHRFYIVTTFILPSFKNLRFSKLNYDNTCAYLQDKNWCIAEAKILILGLLWYCRKIKPYVDYYKQQIKSYNDTAHHILKNKINLILPQLPTKQKWGIITTLVSNFIGLAYEGISGFLHNKRHKALHKAVKDMDSKTTIQCNKVMHLEDSMVMYGIYNVETLEKLIKTEHHIHNFTSSNEKLFAGQQVTAQLQPIYTNMQGIQHYSIKSLLYLRIVKEKYVLMYKEFIMQLCIYATAIRIMAKGYLPTSLITSFSHTHTNH